MILCKGGQGHTIEDAIEVIGAKNSLEGIAAEYNYLAQRFGKKGQDWERVKQELIPEASKFYDKIFIKNLKTNEESFVYFDITSFFGKF
jgi:hypothetical protein